MYQEIILDHYKRPRHAGRLDAADALVHHHNPTCGDELTLGLCLDGDRVTVVGADPVGCAISQAGVSVLAEQVTGRTVTEARTTVDLFRRLMRREVDPDEHVLGDGVAFQGVARHPARVKCALLGWMAFLDALDQALGAREQQTTMPGPAPAGP